MRIRERIPVQAATESFNRTQAVLRQRRRERETFEVLRGVIRGGGGGHSAHTDEAIAHYPPPPLPTHLLGSVPSMLDELRRQVAIEQSRRRPMLQRPSSAPTYAHAAPPTHAHAAPHLTAHRQPSASSAQIRQPSASSSLHQPGSPTQIRQPQHAASYATLSDASRSPTRQLVAPGAQRRKRRSMPPVLLRTMPNREAFLNGHAAMVGVGRDAVSYW